MENTETQITITRNNAGVSGQPGIWILAPSSRFNRIRPTTVNAVPIPSEKPM
jgi:hypothetical protein